MNGAIFCQVRIKIHKVQFIYIIIWGNQKWKGARPALIVKAKKIKMLRLKNELKLRKLESIEAIKIIIIDARAWTRKYLMADSVDSNSSFERIKGINLIKLSSRPSQHKNQEFEVTAITVPATKNIKNIFW